MVIVVCRACTTIVVCSNVCGGCLLGRFFLLIYFSLPTNRLDEFRGASALVGHTLTVESATAEFKKMDENGGGCENPLSGCWQCFSPRSNYLSNAFRSFRTQVGGDCACLLLCADVLYDEFCRWCAHRHLGAGFKDSDEATVNRTAHYHEVDQNAPTPTLAAVRAVGDVGVEVATAELEELQEHPEVFEDVSWYPTVEDSPQARIELQPTRCELVDSPKVTAGQGWAGLVGTGLVSVVVTSGCPGHGLVLR